jgi:beta-galactosidase
MNTVKFSGITPIIIVLAFVSLLAGCQGGGSGGDESPADERGLSYDGGGYDDTAAGRQIYSLNGTWEVEESVENSPPSSFSHTAPVPGMLYLAEPPFDKVGKLSCRRNYFWYRTTFDIQGQQRNRTELVIHKAQFGVSVWLNGSYLGKYDGAFTAARFRADKSMLWGQTNTLLVRVGAWRNSVPIDEPASQDIEKNYWFPGIWDDVELIVSDTPHIVRTKIEPNIKTGEVTVLTTLRNDRITACAVTMHTSAIDPEGLAASSASDTAVSIVPGGETTVVQSVSMNAPFSLWTLENPFLYTMKNQVLASGEELDSLETRFGMRSVEWRAGADKGFYLNGERLLLRGSNIAIHRFMDDKDAGIK